MPETEAVAGLADRTVDLTRRSAVYAIDQAVDAGGTQRWIDRAIAQLDQGDEKRAAGKLDQAMSRYHRAWRYAVRAL